MFKRLLGMAPEVTVPLGALKSSDIEPQLKAHHGIPGTASILAYDAVQRLLAVGTRDGRIKVCGREGVEVCFISSEGAPCKYLEFFMNGSCLIQATTRDHIEVWDLVSQELVTSLEWNAEITAFAVSENTNFIYIGSSGCLHVLQFVDGSLKQMPYFVPPDVTMAGLVKPGSGSAPDLKGILPQPGSMHRRIVLAYENSILVLWDLYDLKVIATRGGSDLQRTRLAESGDRLADLRHAKGGLEKPFEPTDEDDSDDSIYSLCWACPMGSVVAVGYLDGGVSLWAFPSSYENKKGGKPAAMSEFSGVPLRRIGIVQPGQKTPVTRLKWCNDGDSNTKGGGRLYMFGGGLIGLPEVVSIVSLKPESIKKAPKSLPWFGPVEDILLMPSVESPCKANGVMILTQPGQLHIWDEGGVALAVETGETGKPTGNLPDPWAFPFQLGASGLTATKLQLVEDSTFIGEVIAQLRHPLEHKSTSTPSSGTSSLISGGLPGSEQKIGPQRLYFTGYNNGRVHMWDASSATLVQLRQAPENVDEYSGEADGAVLYSVAKIEFCPISGLLVVSHEQGLVRIYVLSGDSRVVFRHTMDAAKTHVDPVPCQPGIQCIAVLKMHHSAVRSIALTSHYDRLALGDDNGIISIVCLRHFRLLHHGPCMAHVSAGIVSMSFAMASIPASGSGTPKHSHSQKPHEVISGPPELVIFVALAKSTIVILEAATGMVMGAGPLSTRRPATTAALHLLDQSGQPIGPLAGPMLLIWALSQPQSETVADSTDSSDSESEENFETPSVSYDLTPSSSNAEVDISGGVVEKLAISDKLDLRDHEEENASNIVEVGNGVRAENEVHHSDVSGIVTPDTLSNDLLELNTVSQTSEEGDGKDIVKEGKCAEIKQPEEEGVKGGDKEDAQDPVDDLSRRKDEGSQKEILITMPHTKGVFARSSPVRRDLIPDPPEGTFLDKQTGMGATISPPTSSSPTHLSSSVPHWPHGNPIMDNTTSPKFSQNGNLDKMHHEPAQQSSPVLPDGDDPIIILEEKSLWPEPVYVLLITEDCMRLYPMASIIQADRSFLKKVPAVEGEDCIWSSVFGIKNEYPFGLLLMTNKGSYGVWSLPDLNPAEQGPLSDILNWPYEFYPSTKQTALAPDGHMIMLAMDTEFARISLFAKEGALWLPESRPQLHIPSAPHPSTEASYQRSNSESSHKNPLAKMLGGGWRTAKALAVTLHVGSQKSSPATANLEILFESSPFGEHIEEPDEGVPISSEEMARKQHASLLGLDEEDLGLHPTPMTLDPIVIEGLADEEIEDNEKHDSKWHSIFKKKEKPAHPKEKETEKQKRDALLGPPSSETSSSKPRTVAEIKAAYGYQNKEKANETSNAAQIAHEKLLERGKKLQEISDTTREMSESAADFGALAEQLLRREQHRKWWEF